MLLELRLAIDGVPFFETSPIRFNPLSHEINVLVIPPKILPVPSSRTLPFFVFTDPDVITLKFALIALVVSASTIDPPFDTIKNPFVNAVELFVPPFAILTGVVIVAPVGPCVPDGPVAPVG